MTRNSLAITVRRHQKVDRLFLRTLFYFSKVKKRLVLIYYQYSGKR
ncbi:MAG: hypothetical protein ACR5K4_01915 [Sodalis sp. (in: enterobacteria)]